MTDRQIEQILQALSDFCDAQDAATQTLRNSLKQIHTATFAPAATQKPTGTFTLPGELQKYVLESKTTPDGKMWLVKLQYVSQEKFKEISDVLKAKGGRFISAGKDSHWEVPI